MKAVLGNALDAIDRYEMLDVPPPTPGVDDILVRVGVCGLGYVDGLVALGRYQVKPSLPHTPGGEIAGTIVDVGRNVTRLRVGDRVVAGLVGGGGLAEYIVLRADKASRLPDNMSFGQAAGFRQNFLTALHGLEDRGALRPRQRLLIFGAAGGVGSAAVQLGKLLGAEVIAAASTSEKRDFARDLGADHVIDTAPDGWRERLREICGGEGPDVIFDPVSGPLFEPAFRSLGWGGRHLVVGFVGGPIPSLPIHLSLLKGAALVGVDVRQFMFREPEAAARHVSTLLQWVADGRLTPSPPTSFAFADFRLALEHILANTGQGRTIVEILPEN
ncbi:NADPH:quinone oxidoreductase family protein [Sphingopyxis sp.]|uniref:NADPH:quinone oxidoreductase family protein n=1 Tax=Sphingopyxis sp. TaxID=1908224 RepID=UPI003BAB08DF